MANTAIGGFRWVKSRRGGNVCPIEERIVITANAAGIFRGDPLKLVSDGTVIPAAAGDAVSHIADGAVRYKNSSGQIVAGNFVPVSTAYNGDPNLSNPEATVVRCIPVIGQIFEADCNTATTSALVQGLMFNNADVAAGAGGSTTTGRSTFVVNNTGAQFGTATAQVRLLEVVPQPDNDVTAVNWKVRVEFNEGNEPSASSATGV